MLSFENDYSEGAHEKILQRFMETNLEKVSGYGSDPYLSLIHISQWQEMQNCICWMSH